VRDSPGFATSRLGITIGLEAIRMVVEGVASVSDIDTAMVLGYRFPVGPLELSDRVGLDVRLAIAEHRQSHHWRAIPATGAISDDGRRRLARNQEGPAMTWAWPRSGPG